MKLYIIILLWCCYITVSGQTKSYSKANKPLSIGEQMYDIPLGELINNPGKENSFLKGKKTWADLKGKTIILDFWGTFCSVCVENFPHMSELQKQFGNDIEIILVNTFEDKEKVTNWLKKQAHSRKGKSALPDNLTIMISPELGNVFPARGYVPYHVWIDKNGIVRLRGIMENTHPKKIKQLLAGEIINFLEDHPSNIDFKTTPFFKALDSNSLITYGTSFWKFNNKIVDPYGISAYNIVDSINKTKRNTFLNISVNDLYSRAYLKDFLNNKAILSGIMPIVLEVKNTSSISRDSVEGGAKITDENFINSSYCYEQILALDTPDSLSELYMKECLNKAFKSDLGIRGELVNREVECYKLIKVETTVLRKAKISQEDEERFRFEGTVSTVFKEYLRGIAGLFYDKNLITVDDTNFQGKLSLLLTRPPTDFKTMDEFRAYLRSFGFDLVKGKKIVEMLVIKDITN